LKETIQELKARNQYLEKKIKFYEREAINNATIINALSNKTLKNKQTFSEFKKWFLKRFRESLKK